METESIGCRWSGLLKQRGAQGMTLIEVAVSLAVVGITSASVISGYVYSMKQMEVAACSTAAEMAARQRLEQARAAKWDTLAEPAVDELVSSNFPVLVLPLDIPVSGNKAVHGTNITNISIASEDPPLKLIKVDCVWSLPPRGPFTNTLMIYRAPDQ